MENLHYFVECLQSIKKFTQLLMTKTESNNNRKEIKSWKTGGNLLSRL